MKTYLSRLLTQAAKDDPKVIVLSADHGYQLFDEIRRECPKQFINCGIIEQAMIGIAAGLARVGYRPIVYGLASFVPMRCLEQIKLDICYSNLPVVILGDGAGLVYSTLGASHHCGEDLAALRAMPNLKIYSPPDKIDLEICLKEALSIKKPTYLRIGRTDLPSLGPDSINLEFDLCVVSSGSMVYRTTKIAKSLKIQSFSPYRIKPLHSYLIDDLCGFKTVVVIEEHSKHGGLYSAIVEEIAPRKGHRPRVVPICLKDQFADKCGSWQYALSEHEMDDASLERRVREILKST
jgi:transketolase